MQCHEDIVVIWFDAGFTLPLAEFSNDGLISSKLSTEA
jgi:hypothetical protein